MKQGAACRDSRPGGCLQQLRRHRCLLLPHLQLLPVCQTVLDGHSSKGWLMAGWSVSEQTSWPASLAVRAEPTSRAQTHGHLPCR